LQVLLRHGGSVEQDALTKHEGGEQQDYEDPKDKPEPGRSRAPSAFAAWRKDVQRLRVRRVWVRIVRAISTTKRLPLLRSGAVWAWR